MWRELAAMALNCDAADFSLGLLNMADKADTPEAPRFPAVELPSEATSSPEAAIRYLVGQLAMVNDLPAQTANHFARAVLACESLGSTAIGKGVAVPHGISGALERVIGILGNSSKGIDWRAVDGMLVHRICLIAAPADRPGEYIRAFERVARELRR
jgi:nitrogen PTS system EIIA component